MQIELQNVKSTNIAAVGYDEQSSTLRIRFLEGATYDYFGVPSRLFNQLMEAKSKGSLFQEHINKQFPFKRVNPNQREEGNVMGQNKAQKQAAERAKTAAPAVQPQPVAEQPKPAASPAKPAAQPLPTPSSSKQSEMINKLKAAWTAKKVDLGTMTIRDDGKFKLIVVDAGWPTVQIGPTGGITVLELRSYAKAFDAAIDGLALFTKQNDRDKKKAAAPAPPPTPAAKETPTARKTKAHAQIEQQMQPASA